MSDMPTKQISPFTRCLIAVWGIAILSGVLGVTAYSNTPGSRLKTASDWPTETAIERSVNVPTIVLFVHPKCPCSLSTLRELGRSLGDPGDSVAVRIGLYCPLDLDDSWTDTKLRTIAEQIFPGASFVDRNGVEAKRFSAATSGHVFAFSADGECLFSGGATSSRGHEGDNLGVQAIRQIVAGKPTSCKTTPVFGCPIAVNAE